MAINKERKQRLVDQYTELLKQSEAVFLTEYTGLDVKQMQNLRAEVRKADGRYLVTKNTLLHLAIEESGKPVPEDLLVGQVGSGFAMSEAPAVAKAAMDSGVAREKIDLIEYSRHLERTVGVLANL